MARCRGGGHAPGPSPPPPRAALAQGLRRLQAPERMVGIYAFVYLCIYALCICIFTCRPGPGGEVAARTLPELHPRLCGGGRLRETSRSCVTARNRVTDRHHSTELSSIEVDTTDHFLWTNFLVKFLGQTFWLSFLTTSFL